MTFVLNTLAEIVRLRYRKRAVSAVSLTRSRRSAPGTEGATPRPSLRTRRQAQRKTSLLAHGEPHAVADRRLADRLRSSMIAGLLARGAALPGVLDLLATAGLDAARHASTMAPSYMGEVTRTPSASCPPTRTSVGLPEDVRARGARQSWTDDEFRRDAGASFGSGNYELTNVSISSGSRTTEVATESRPGMGCRRRAPRPERALLSARRRLSGSTAK